MNETIACKKKDIPVMREYIIFITVTIHFMSMLPI